MSTRAKSMLQRLRTATPLVIDGALGTELERRGVATGLPLWSAHALLECPEVVSEIHREYSGAGAEVLTANTFRTQRRTLDNAGLGARAGELTQLAVDLARAASGDSGWVAGSVPPLEDCYRPDRVPPDAALRVEHAEHIGHLVRAGVDLLLIETMNSIREATIAVELAARSDLPVWASFVCDADARLLSGESLSDALGAVLLHEPQALLVNCLPPSAVPASLPVLAARGIPFGVYANLGEPNDDTGFSRSEEVGPREFARRNVEWLSTGATLLGGCCGTGPDHIAALVESVSRESVVRSNA